VYQKGNSGRLTYYAGAHDGQFSLPLSISDIVRCVLEAFPLYVDELSIFLSNPFLFKFCFANQMRCNRFCRTDTTTNQFIQSTTNQRDKRNKDLLSDLCKPRYLKLQYLNFCTCIPCLYKFICCTSLYRT
jgi:hypothetical protein